MTDVNQIVTSGDRVKSLRALRDRLAEELDEERAAAHKRECHCTCGMGDGRVIVALIKELRAVMVELDSLPGAKEADPLDRLADGVQDDLAAARARRTSGQPDAASS